MLIVTELEPGGSAQPLDNASRGYLEQSKTRATVRAYRLDWQDFLGWCADQRLQPLPAAPSTVCGYLSALAEAGARASTIQRRVASISQAHQAAGHVPSPTQAWEVRTVLRGIRRQLGVSPRQKQALVLEQLRPLVATLPASARAGRPTEPYSWSASPALSAAPNWLRSTSTTCRRSRTGCAS